MPATSSAATGEADLGAAVAPHDADFMKAFQELHNFQKWFLGGLRSLTMLLLVGLNHP